MGEWRHRFVFGLYHLLKSMIAITAWVGSQCLSRLSMISLCHRDLDLLSSNIHTRPDQQVRVRNIDGCKVWNGHGNFIWLPGKAWKRLRQLISCVKTEIKMRWSKQIKGWDLPNWGWDYGSRSINRLFTQGLGDDDQ